MAQQEPEGGDIPGCMDPISNTYNPNATIDDGSCIYGNQFVGCTDPTALNYQSAANVNCVTVIQQFGAAYLTSQGIANNGVTCCIYATPPAPPAPTATTTTTGTIVVVVPPIVTATTCNGPYSLTTNNIVNGVNSVTCCNSNTINTIALKQNQTYYWDGTHCYLRNNCPTSTCLNCDNFNYWNDLYIKNHNGQSLQTTNNPTWMYLLNAITNSGDTFYYNISNGDFLDEVCCTDANGTFLPKYNICSCKVPAPEVYVPRCMSSLSDIMNLISGTTSGSTFFNNNFQTIGPSLGLTNQQINYIITNLTTTDIQSKVILSNALTVTGGFHVNFGTLTNTPKLMTNTVCTQYGGYWDSNNNCMCKPIVDQCEIDITQVEVVSSKDFYNETVQIVKYNSQNGGGYISEACCNRLVKDYNMPYVWQNQPTPFCYAKPKEVCLPAVFSLNDNKPMEVPACDTDLELSMWVYFGAPKNPCGPLPFPPDDDIIIIDGQFCDITLSGTTPNTGAIIPNLNGDIKTELVGGVREEIVTKKCCYNNLNPIVGQISLTDSTLNSFLIQSKVYNSSLDYFDKWVQIKAILPSSGTTLNFNVNFEITQGLSCCCDYDIFIDDIRVDCVKEVPSMTINDIQCPGFDLTRVIDNKKSWVYNPGLPSVGLSEYDEIERNDGSFGTLNGEGTINRTFAPSGDADIPWRYTDYFKQSSIYENHSNLVLNTKELDLTFDMCADCISKTITTYECPPGFILSGGTNICYQEISQKIFQDGDDFIFMDGDDYIYQ